MTSYLPARPFSTPATRRGKGIAVTTSDRFTLKIVLSDGQHSAEWDSDPGSHEGTLKINTWQHVVVTVDGGPKIVTFVIDGTLNDGGPVRQYGWGRFKPELSDVNGSPRAVLAKPLLGELKKLPSLQPLSSNFRGGG